MSSGCVVPDPDEAFAPLLSAIRIVRGELAPDRAVVGFCGGPFTVAGYLVEGRPSRDFATVKQLMYAQPDVWHALLDRLADCFAGYVTAQERAGADVIQLFDSWVGALSVADYQEFVTPYSARILAAPTVPTIHFGTGASNALLRALTRAGGDVIGLDWRLPLDEGWETVGHDRGVQGNLDPAALLGPWDACRACGARCIGARCGTSRAHLQPRPRRPAAHRSRRGDAAGGAGARGSGARLDVRYRKRVSVSGGAR